MEHDTLKRICSICERNDDMMRKIGELEGVLLDNGARDDIKEIMNYIQELYNAAIEANMKLLKKEAQLNDERARNEYCRYRDWGSSPPNRDLP